MKKPRDSQRSKVYRFDTLARLELEDTRGDMLLSDCERLMRQVFDDHKEPMVMLADGRGRRSSCASIWRVSLTRSGRTKEVVLHEVAHVLTGRQALKMGIRVAGHGPEYAGVLYYLLVRYTDLGKKSNWILAQFDKLKIKMDSDWFQGKLTEYKEAA